MKCKKNEKKVGSRCVSNGNYKLFGNISDEISIVRIALLGAFASAGGWAIFSGFVKIFKLDNIGGFWLILIGIAITVLIYKFGLQKHLKKWKKIEIEI